MKLKVLFTWLIIWAAAAQGSAVAQTTGKLSANDGPRINSIAPPGLLYGADLGQQNETYVGLHSFWSDDVISEFFKKVADGALNEVRPLLATLCDKWKSRDPHLPVTGVITVPPGIELDLNKVCT